MATGSLFIVATPIGNLQDMTMRAVEILGRVSYICCEDTRVTRKLLAHFHIQKPLARLDAHARGKQFRQVADDVLSGKEIAVVTDAGTPAISDPGAALVAYVAHYAPESVITPIPGPSALTAALSAAGIAFEAFIFLGFPPAKKGRVFFFKKIADESRAIVFYESVHRIRKTLSELAAAIGERRIVLCRELTKQFESVYRGSAREIAEKDFPEKGEFVIVVAPR